jgi:23S rRNA pseudouridine2605 synthase
MPRTSESHSDPEDAGALRLQKYLARSGVASRRRSEELIAEGRVRVNDEIVAAQGAKVTPGVDVVEVDGEQIRLPESASYIVLNKPSGVVTTMDDPQGRPTVAGLLPDAPGLVPVGRLDRDTTGVLLATSDGELTHRLLHPSHHVPKVYVVTVEGRVTDRAVEELAAGVPLDDGPTRPTEVAVLERDDARSVLTLTLREGRKRQVKRVCAAVGYPVTELHRRSFGAVDDHDLPPGEWRTLTEAEVRALRAAAGLEG